MHLFLSGEEDSDGDDEYDDDDMELWRDVGEIKKQGLLELHVLFRPQQSSTY